MILYFSCTFGGDVSQIRFFGERNRSIFIPSHTHNSSRPISRVALKKGTIYKKIAFMVMVSFYRGVLYTQRVTVKSLVTASMYGTKAKISRLIVARVLHTNVFIFSTRKER